MVPDKLCSRCKYWRKVSPSTGAVLMCCHYLLDTGRCRQGTADDCGSFERKPRKPRKLRRRKAVSADGD